MLQIQSSTLEILKYMLISKPPTWYLYARWQGWILLATFYFFLWIEVRAAIYAHEDLKWDCAKLRIICSVINSKYKAQVETFVVFMYGGCEDLDGVW